MVSKPVIVGVALAGVAAAAVGAYSYNRLQQQRSLAQGITQTQQSLAKVDDLLNENQGEITKLLASAQVDLGQQLEDASQINVSTQQQSTPLGDTVSVFNTASNGFVAATAFQNRDYLQAVGQTAGAVAAVWGQFDPRVKYGNEAIDIAANLYEAQALFRQQEQLLQDQATLQQQLVRLQGNDPQASADWQQIFNNLHGNSTAEHEAFLKWLDANGLSEKEVIAKALANAAKSGPAAASQLASGMTIVDPNQTGSNLSDIPGINPDFIAALKRCNQNLADWQQRVGESVAQGQADQAACAAAGIKPGDCPQSAAARQAALAARSASWANMTCNKYADGRYVPAFGSGGGKLASLADSTGPKSDASRQPRATRDAASSTGATAGSELTKPTAPNSSSPGPRGISVQWTGANAVGIDIVDSAQKLKLGYFACGGGQTCKQDVAAGNYYLKFSAPGFEHLVPVSVSSAGISELKPAAGAIAVHWTGANAVGIDVVDSTQKFKLGYFACGNGQTCKQDVAAGNYYLKFSAPGFEHLVTVNVNAAGTSELRPAAGVISVHWSGVNAVGIDVVDSGQKFKLGYFACGSGQTCKQDAAAGSYYLKFDAPGFEHLIPISVRAGSTSEIAR